MAEGLRGRVALVTGSSQGIGNGVALEPARRRGNEADDRPAITKCRWPMSLMGAGEVCFASDRDQPADVA
jgi:NAD(P)-dependent dehydrogenase (short-subunit alcohol dehydrogenase family)